MQAIYAELCRQARKIADRQPQPDFYRVFSPLVKRSRELFLSSALITPLRMIVRDETGSNLGHGPGHAEAVALDAGTITAIEAGRAGLVEEQIDHIILLVHCAGLLHDIRRRLPDHARQGAAAAREYLEQMGSLSAPDIDHIAVAIRNHEAFKTYSRPRSLEGRIIADSLYDADKFRWGPDNFTHTVWDMIADRPLPPAVFARHYSPAMAYIADIKKTFRTPTGRRYGPQIIDTGLHIGHELWLRIKRHVPGIDPVEDD